MDLEAMIDDFITFFIAGQETTANTLAFCFQEIARNPHVLAKLRKEIDEAIGSKTELDFDDIAKLNYTSCVYKETLRLWPPIPEIARLVKKGGFKIDGYEIPVDSWLQVNLFICI